MKKYCVYRVYHIKSGREYIGYTSKGVARFRGHMSTNHHCLQLRKDYKKCGSKGFVFEVLEEFDDRMDALRAEREYFFKSTKPYNTRAPSGHPEDRKRDNRMRVILQISTVQELKEVIAILQERLSQAL